VLSDSYFKLSAQQVGVILRVRKEKKKQTIEDKSRRWREKMEREICETG